MSAEKVVLAYSGGLDTSVAIGWIGERTGAEVIAVAVDVGQGGEDLETIRKRALACGAVEAEVVDAREEFAETYCIGALRANALYMDKYPLVSALSRPVIVAHLARVAAEKGATIVAHGCTGKGNDQVRFELTYKALAPGLKIIAPWREWTIQSREDAIAYARQHGIPIEQTEANIYSRDRNLWHLSHEGGRLEDPVAAPEEAMWQWITPPESAPDRPAEVEIGFEAGVPVSLDGHAEAPVELIDRLNAVAAAHGVGRIDIVENRLVGIKSRGAYETPGGTLLVAAHRELESICLDRETAHFQQALSHRYAELVYYGLWFTTLREALDGFFTVAARRVTGSVGLKLYKGNVTVTRRSSPYSLYRADLASFNMARYNPKDAEGFINLFALPVTLPSGDVRP